MNKFIFVGVFAIAQIATAQTTPQALNLQGRLTRADGSAVETASVSFLLQIRSPLPESCVLFEEVHTVNMGLSDGMFSIQLGRGTRSGSAFEDVSNLRQVFDNSTGAISSLTCASGTSYDPAPGDVRKLRISFDEGTGVQTLAQDQNIEAVPYAVYADSVQGKTPTDFVQTVPALEAIPGTSQSRVNRLIDTDWAGLDALLLGTSTLYAKASPTAAVSNNNQRLINVADPTGAQDAATKNYTDTTIGGYTATVGILAAGDAGKAITWDGTKWVASTISTTDSTKVAKAGDTMTGTLNLPANGLVAGTNQLVLSGGNVGIGTTTPGNTLEVAGRTAIKHTSGAYTPVLYLDNPVASATGFGPHLLFRGSSNVSMGSVGTQWEGASGNNSSLVFETATTAIPSEKMRITSAGNVGIGTTTPTQPLEVSGQTRLNGNVGIGQAPSGSFALGVTGGIIASTQINAGVYLATPQIYGGAAAGGNIRIDGTTSTTVGNILLAPGGGNVGIGTTTPGSPLSVAAPSNVVYSTSAIPTASQGINIANSTTNAGGAFSQISMSASSNSSTNTARGAINLINLTSGSHASAFSFQLRDNSSTTREVLRLSDSGNVGIGTTSPARQLHVAGPVRITPAALPGTPAAGDLAFDSAASNALKFYDGSAWQTVGTGTGVDSTKVLKTGDTMTGALNLPANGLVAGTNQLVLSGGNVGIGTASPGALFHVVGASRLQGGTAIYNGGILTFSDSGLDRTTTFGQNNDSDFRITSSSGDINLMPASSVGIGTTSPARLLHVNGPMRLTAAALPGTPGTGDIAIDSGAGNALKYYNGSAWVTPSSLTVGQVAGTAMGADAVPNCTAAQKLQMSLGPTFAWSCVTDADGTDKVAKAGDTMTGNLNISATTIASNTSTGALVVAGGAGIGGALHVGNGMLTTGNSSAVYSPTSSTLNYPTGGRIQVQNANAAANGTYAGFTMLANNSNGNAQRAFMGAVSNSGAGTYTPTIVIGQQVTDTQSYTERMRIDPSGNVGIASTSPSAYLHVGSALPTSLRSGNTAIFGASGTATAVNGITIASGSGGANTFIDFGASGAGAQNGSIQYHTSSNYMSLHTNYNERIRIDSTGNVGIGTTNPSVKLEVNGSISAAGNIWASTITAANIPSFYTLNSPGGTAGYWTRIMNVTFSQQYMSYVGKIELMSGTTATRAANATIGLKVAQVAAMGSAPSINLDLDSSSSIIRMTDVVTVTTVNSASQTVVGLYVRMNTDWDTFNWAPVTYSGWNDGVSYTGTALAAALPSGTQTAALPGKSIWAFNGASAYFNTGNVGIGTSSPGDKLQVATTDSTGGVATFSNAFGGASPGANVTIRSSAPSGSGNTAGSLIFSANNSAAASRGYATISGLSAIHTSGSEKGQLNFSAYDAGAFAERMTILGSNVGIGTTAPTYPLTVLKDQNAGTYVAVSNSNAGASAAAAFVAGNDITTGYASMGVGGTGNTTFSGIIQDKAHFSAGAGTAGMILLTEAATPITFAPAAAEAMRISSGGNVGIGTTSPGYKLQVAGVIAPTGDGANDLGAASNRFRDIYASNGTVQTSDVRQKENIKNSDLGLEFINSLRPVSYTWKNGDKNLHYGVIAQETEQALIAAKRASGRTGEVDNTIVTRDKKSDAYGVRYTELIAPLIKAVQQLYHGLLGTKQIVAQHEREIASIKAASADTSAKLMLENEKLKQENAEIKARLDKIEKMLESK